MAVTPTTHTRWSTVWLALLVAVLGVAVIPSAQAKGTTDFCLKHPLHDRYHLIKVGGRAMESLMEFPGGAPVGDPIPTDGTHVFGPDCSPIPIPADDPVPTTTTTSPATTTTLPPATTTTSPSTTTTTSPPPSTTTTTSPPPSTTTTTSPSTTTTTSPSTTTTTSPSTTTTTSPSTTTTTSPSTPQVIARAWSVDGSGDSVLIAQLTDMDSSGTPTAGDIIATAYFPLRTDASSFGAFGVTYHSIGGGFVGTAADGATVVRAWAACGEAECHFEWSVFDDGATRYERYSEFLVLSDGGSTARTGFYDTTDEAEQDVLSVNPSSPSDPSVLAYDGAVSAADDPFLEVSVG